MKSVFITGAASGIGLATARRFAHRGWFVGLYDINEFALEAIKGSGDIPKACFGKCDVTSRKSIEAALADFTRHTHGQLHLVVNNAGVLSAGDFSEIAPGAHDLMIDINVKGFTHVAQAAFPYLRDTPGAGMVNLCSASSIQGIPNLAVYSSTKFYVNGLTQALHVEWAPHDIRVSCVKPHLVNTPMAHDVVASAASEQEIKLTPEDIAEAIDVAAHGGRVSYVVGGIAKAWAFVNRLLPEFLQFALVRRLTRG